MSGTEKEEASDKINKLPDELVLNILKFLPLNDILRCECVCRRWRKLARDITLWRNIAIVYSGKTDQLELCERNLQILNTHSECVNCIKLMYLFNTPLMETIFKSCQNLTSLELILCRVGSNFENVVKSWPKLKKINLKNCILLEPNSEVPIVFSNFKDLSYLGLTEFGLSSDNFRSLLQCTHLNHIFIEKIRNLSKDDVKELIMCKQNKIESFHIYGAESIDDKCLHLLSKCLNLKDLAIIRCEGLTDKGLLAMACLRIIEHLQLWNNDNFSELALLSTLGSPTLFKLKSLSLSRIKNISPVIVDVISEYYKVLKFLALYQCPRIIHTDYEKQLKSKFRNIDVVLY